MKAADLPETDHYTHRVAWVQNGKRHLSQPYAITHEVGRTWLHIDGWQAHGLKDEQEVEVLW